MTFILWSTVLSVVSISVAPKNVRSGEQATVVVSVSAFPEVTGVTFLSLPSESAQEPTRSIASDNVTFEFASVDRYSNGNYTVNLTSAVVSTTIEFQLTVYC